MIYTIDTENLNWINEKLLLQGKKHESFNGPELYSLISRMSIKLASDRLSHLRSAKEDDYSMPAQRLLF